MSGAPMASTDNPFGMQTGPSQLPQLPEHFRRHGSLEQSYGGFIGITPTTTPPRSEANSPRGSPRTRRRSHDDDEPNGRRRDRSRDRDGRESQASSAPTNTPTSMPSEWGARTLRLERIIQELHNEVTQLKSQITTLGGDHVRLNALENTLPERVHQCEARQANHIEILNGFAKNASEQVASLQHRMSQIEHPPSFGAGGGGATHVPASPQQQFDIGSPISDPFGGRTSASPQHMSAGMPMQPPNMAAPSRPTYQSQPNYYSHSAKTFVPKEWNVSDKKVSKALNLFNGHAQHYRNWSDRVKDHCKETNCGYGFIFNLIEAQKTRISNSNLSMGKLDDGTEVDFKWLSQHLWVFIGKNIDNDLHGRRLALTQNEQDNGFELWRALYVENEGGAEQVQLGGMSNLHSFPQCPRIDDLQHWLGQWQMTRQKYGADLPEVHLKQMFLNMLPETVAHKLRERKDLNTLQQYINEVDADLGRLNDAKLAKLHQQRMSTALRAGSRSPVNALVEEHQ